MYVCVYKIGNWCVSINIVMTCNEACYRLDNVPPYGLTNTENNLIYDISGDSWRRPIDIRYSKAAIATVTIIFGVIRRQEDPGTFNFCATL